MFPGNLRDSKHAITSLIAGAFSMIIGAKIPKNHKQYIFPGKYVVLCNVLFGKFTRMYMWACLNLPGHPITKANHNAKEDFSQFRSGTIFYLPWCYYMC